MRADAPSSLFGAIDAPIESLAFMDPPNVHSLGNNNRSPKTFGVLLTHANLQRAFGELILGATNRNVRKPWSRTFRI